MARIFETETCKAFWGEILFGQGDLPDQKKGVNLKKMNE